MDETLNTGAEELEAAAPSVEEPETVSIEEVLPELAAQDAPQQAENGEEEQEEPEQEKEPSREDIAFGKRLAAKQRQIERQYAPYRQTYDMAKQLLGIENDDPYAVVKAIEDKIAEEKAQQYGVDKGLIKDIYRMQAPQTQPAFTEDDTKDIIAQEEELKKLDPDFDVLAASKENDVFFDVLKATKDVKRALAAAQPERYEAMLQKKIEAKVTGNIAARASRPQSEATVKPTKAKIDINNLTFEQMEQLENEARKGKRVLLE